MNLDYLINSLREWSPRMVEIMTELGEDVVKDVQIGIPLDGGRPYFGIMVRRCVFAPADPGTRALFKEMDDILWNMARQQCEQAMADVQFLRSHFGYVFTEAERDLEKDEDALVDVEWVEVVPEERRVDA